MAKTEAQARIKINKMLEKTGWRLLDGPDGLANVQLEAGVKLTQQELDQQGNDFEKTSKGFVDYLLLDKDSFPLAVLEAKSEAKNPLDGKEQARRYADDENIRFVILSNGRIHYFWDLESGNPEIITEFPRQESLKGRAAFKPNSKTLCDENIDEDYIAVTQRPDIATDPYWRNHKKSLSAIHNIKFLRPYQLKAIKALQASVQESQHRFLFEMATGTGKTLLSTAIIKLFLRTGNAKRVLFLVDRLELEKQAHKNFVDCLKTDYQAVIYKEHKKNWHKAEIVVSTIQSLLAGDRYKSFSPTDFDLLISDEAHRAIGGDSRAVFEYFVGYKLGLTATPKDYLKNIDASSLSEKDQRTWERRVLLDTYQTFGCEAGQPTFKYSLTDGVKDGYLLNPKAVDVRTDVTTQLLSDKGYSVMVKNALGEEDEKSFYHKDFEKRFFSEKTNLVFCKSFLENAMKDPISKECGKGLVFCVSQSHASKVTQILNQMASKVWPDKYNSDFAVQVTSNVDNAQRMTVDFANNKLNGKSRFMEGYRTSKTRVCVTVGMMTTGYDCQDILNLCLMRPIFSPTDFVQMKGRGTRKFTFKYQGANSRKKNVEKTGFKLFDYFGNYEYFEEKFNYDEALTLPPVVSSGDERGDGEEGVAISIDDIEIFDPDKVKSQSEVLIGPEGMRVDREFWGKARDELSKDLELKRAVEQEEWDKVERVMMERYEDKPELYLNLEKIRRAENLDRRLNWQEVLQRMFGLIDRFRTRDELLGDECDKFISIYKPDSQDAHHIRNYLRAYVMDKDFREIIDSRQFARLYDSAIFSMEDFKKLNGQKVWRDKVPEYVKNYVHLNTFMD